MTPLRLVLVLVFVAAASLPVALGSLADDGRSAISERDAREVVAAFFGSLNARRYEETCALLADGYYASRPGSSRERCAIGLRIGFLWSQEIRWRITAARVRDDRAIVETVADGTAGRLVLVRSAGGLRILAVETE